jgi:hypothetical protein
MCDLVEVNAYCGSVVWVSECGTWQRRGTGRPEAAVGFVLVGGKLNQH